MSKSYAGCPLSDYESLVKNWQRFHAVAISASSGDLVDYFSFPVRLYGLVDGKKPILISREAFLEHYDEIFRQVEVGRDSIVFSSLKQSSGKLSSKRVEFEDGCRRLSSNGLIDIDYYTFQWSKKGEWKIVALQVESDFDLLKQFDSRSNKKK